MDVDRLGFSGVGSYCTLGGGPPMQFVGVALITELCDHNSNLVDSCKDSLIHSMNQCFKGYAHSH